MEQPDAGDIIPGSSGCRKLRWAAKEARKRTAALRLPCVENIGMTARAQLRVAEPLPEAVLAALHR